MPFSLVELAALATCVLGATLYLSFRHWAPEHGLRRWQGPGSDRLAGMSYALAPAEAVEAEALELPSFVSIETCEFFGAGKRDRVVLTLKQGSSSQSVAEIARVLEVTSERLLALSGAHIVVVELGRRSHGPSDADNWVAVRTQDGKGWHGVLPVGTFFIEGPKHLNLNGDQRWEG